MKIKFQQYYYASTRQPINISKNGLTIKKICEEFWEPCLICWDKRHFLLTISPPGKINNWISETLLHILICMTPYSNSKTWLNICNNCMGSRVFPVKVVVFASYWPPMLKWNLCNLFTLQQYICNHISRADFANSWHLNVMGIFAEKQFCSFLLTPRVSMGVVHIQLEVHQRQLL